MRNKVTIKKIDFKQLEALHYELELFATYISNNTLKTDFLHAIMCLDIASNLYFKLRNKLENSNTFYFITFSASEAALIIKCFNYNRPDRPIYAENVLNQICQILEPALQSMV